MKFDFDVLAAVSPAPRGEFLNIGLAVWIDGLPEIRADVSPSRLAAVDPNYPRLPVFRSLLEGTLNAELAPLLTPSHNNPDALRMLFDTLVAPIQRVSQGALFCEPGELEGAIDDTLNRLVRRQALTIRQDHPRRPASKLQSQLKSWMRGAKIMGRSMDDLSKRRIVSNYPVSVEADVYADFAYKNGALHVIETLDLRGVEHVNSTLRNTAAFKSITLDLARDIVGERGQRIGIVAATDYAAIRPVLRLFERNSDEIFAIDSPSDAQRFADLLARGLHIDGGLLPVELP